VYEDDGISQAYLRGIGSWTRMIWNDATSQLTIEPGAATNSPDPASRTPVRTLATPREFRVQLLPEGTTRIVAYTGQRIVTTF
jgi:hypothetical protein